MRIWGSAFVLGLFFWTLLEYGLHRFVFHRFRGIIGSFHLEHHAAPRDRRYLFVRPPYAVAASVLLIALIWAVTRSFAQTTGLISGIWTGYAYYESVHFRVHFTASEGRWISAQRKRHFHHHFQDARRSFGVTTPLWDYVFGTRQAQKLRG